MDVSNTITDLGHEEVANLQRIHPVDNRDREERPPTPRKRQPGSRHRKTPPSGPLPPTYTPDGHVADDTISHKVDVSA